MTAVLVARSRELVFAAIGLFVAAVGTLVLVVLVEVAGVNPHFAYVAQAATAIELNFALSRLVTWRDRRATGSGVAVTWLRFHATRAVTVPLNQFLFSALVLAGGNYVVANVVCVGAVSAINYIAGDRWIFRVQQGEPAGSPP